MGLGPYPDISFAEARKKAEEARKASHDARDPLEARKAERASRRIAEARKMTFQECAKAYIATHEKGWKNAKHAYQWPATLEAYVYPVFGDLPVDAIDTALIVKALRPIWSDKHETATRVRGRIERILNWAKVQGLREGENPALWRGHLDNLLPKQKRVKKHQPALPLFRTWSLHGSAQD